MARCLHKPRIKRAVNSGKLTHKGEEKAHKFLEKYEKFLKQYEIDYGDLYPIPRPERSRKEGFDWRIKAKAWKILRTKNPLQYIADSCSRVVLGSETSFKKLTCCISAQNINQTAGLHPKLNGDSSGGKTITVYCFAHHLPREMVIKGSMSTKAGFYHDDGDRVLRILDDYTAGNEDLDTVIKQTSSEFHVPYQHRTVIKQAPATLSIGSEQTWAITSVDSSQDIQVLNRQLPINTDDSITLTEKVNKRTVERYARGEVQLPLDETVLVCRAIFQILRDQDKIGVRIPFQDRIEWLDTSNRRNPSIFMDLLISITALNRYQRERDAEGYYLATVEDFNTAKALFTDKDAEELVKRLTTRERDVIDQLIGNSSGLTRDELAEKIKVAPDRISQILNGQKGSGGLRQKVQIAETRKSESITINKDTADEKRITIYKTIYSLKDYDRFTGFDAVVRLRPALDEPAKPPKYGLSNQLSKTTDSRLNQLSKISKKEKEREEREKKDIGSLAEDLSRENGKMAKFAKPVEPDSESTYLAGAKPSLASLAGSEDSGSIFPKPEGFTDEEHEKLLRVVAVLEKHKLSFVIQSAAGKSLVSESGLPPERIKRRLERAGFSPHVLKSGIEIWKLPAREPPAPTIKEQQAAAEKERQAKEEHFEKKVVKKVHDFKTTKEVTKQMEPKSKHSPPPRVIFCANCGIDLTGRKFSEINGKFYCFMPSCAAAREEAAV